MAAVDATVEKLRAQCLSRGASGIQGLARFFRRLDRNGSRALDAAELQRGLAELGLALDTAEAEGVCRRWDRDGSGTLDLEEFLRALRPPMSQAREAVIAAAFAKLDRSGDGVVTVDDLRGVYNGRAHPKVQERGVDRGGGAPPLPGQLRRLREGRAGGCLRPSPAAWLLVPTYSPSAPGHAGRVPGLLQRRERLRGHGRGVRGHDDQRLAAVSSAHSRGRRQRRVGSPPPTPGPPEPGLLCPWGGGWSRV
uniref:EF-hand domain-containing protein n=1 Tax=Equus asinus TaxID=9793 RepID=A0A9L0JM07_EQUAS